MAAPSSSSGGRSNSQHNTGNNSKSQKPNKIILLKLPSTLLARFPGSPASVSDVKSEEKSKASSPSTDPVQAPPAGVSPDTASDGASTPATGAMTQPPSSNDPSRRKGVPGPKPGSKRGLGQGVDAVPKPRGKPGPKKKPRLEDGTIDSTARTSGPTATHKLGPKANQGAINAGLRALDRTGKPCRKWERKSFNLKSFTGVVWQVPTWSAPPKPKLAEEVVSSDAKNGEDTGNNSKEANNSASAAQSEKSNSGEVEYAALAGNGNSSPAPIVSAAS